MSRTDHPRLPGTHRAGHPFACRDCDGYGCYWCCKSRHGRRGAMSERAAIVEQIADMDDQRRLPDWEEELLDQFEVDRVERLADWERELLDIPADVLWRTEGAGLNHVWAPEPEDDDPTDVHWDDPATCDDEGEGAQWLTGDPHHFFDAVGDAWVIEGPSTVSAEPQREGHYVRVWQLARDLNVESKHVVEVLRTAGEYVRGHQSWIAAPVAEAVMQGREWIVDQYGQRPAPKPDPLAKLRALMAVPSMWEEPAKVTRPTRGVFAPRPAPRPGAPRSGSSPFLAR